MEEENPFADFAPDQSGENPFSEFSLEQEDEDDALIPTDKIDVDMYDRFEDIDQAQEYYESLIARNPDGSFVNPNVSFRRDPVPTYAFDPFNVLGSFKGEQTGEKIYPMYEYTDPNTGNTEVIPRPNRSMFGLSRKPTVNALQKFSLGMGETISDMMVTGAAAIDKVAGTNLTEKAQENRLEVDTPGFGDSLIADAIPAIITAVVPGTQVYKATQGITAATRGANLLVKTLGNIARTAPAALAGEVVATAGTSTDEEPFLFGPNGMFGNVAELGDDEASRVLEHRANILTEGLILGGALAGTVQLGKATVGLGYELMLSAWAKIAGGDKQIQKAVYMKLSQELSNLSPDAGLEEIEAARRRIAEIVKENKDVIVNDINNLDESKTLVLDTVGALLKGSDAADIPARQSIRQGVVQTGEGTVAEAMNRPVTEAASQLEAQREILAEGQDQFDVMSDAAESATTQLRQNVEAGSDVAAAAQQQFDQEVGTALQGIKDDLTFTGELERLEKATAINIGANKNAAFKDIISGLERGIATMTAEKNLRYAAIKDGIIDAEAVYDELTRLIDLEDLTQASRTFKRGSLVANFVDQLKPQRVEAEVDGKMKMVLEEPSEVQARVTNWLAENGSFGLFYNEIRPELAKLASDAFSSDNKNLGRRYRELIKYIDEDMVTYIEEAGEDELADAAREAKRYYKDEFAPIWRQEKGKGVPTVMTEFARIWEGTLGKTSADELASVVTKTERYRPGFEEGAGGLVSSVLGSGNQFAVKNLAKALQQAGDPGRVADYYILDRLSTFATDIQTAGMEGVDFGKFTNSMQKYADELVILARQYPELNDKIQSINTFADRLRAATGNKKRLNQIIENTKTLADQTMREIESSVLNEFVDKSLTPSVKNAILQGADIATTSNPEAIFQGIFRNKESVSLVSQLMSEMANSPQAGILNRGLKLAYNRYLDKELLAITEELGGVRPARVAKIERALDGTDPLFRIGEQIYGANSPIIDSLKTTLSAASESAQKARGTPMKSQSATGYNLATQTATNRLIYMTFGPLSRSGTRTRSIASAILDKADPDKTAAKFLAEMLANPDEYLRLAEKYNRNPRDPLLENLMIGFISRAAVKTDSEDDTPDLVDRMQQELNQMGEAINTMGN